MPFAGHVSNAYTARRGMLRVREAQVCLDKMGLIDAGLPGLYPCHGKSMNQIWLLTSKFEIRTIDGLCLDYALPSAGGDVVMQACHSARGNQEWRYNLSGTHRIMHALSRLCLEVTPERRPRMSTCRGLWAASSRASSEAAYVILSTLTIVWSVERSI